MSDNPIRLPVLTAYEVLTPQERRAVDTAIYVNIVQAVRNQEPLGTHALVGASALDASQLRSNNPAATRELERNIELSREVIARSELQMMQAQAMTVEIGRLPADQRAAVPSDMSAFMDRLIAVDGNQYTLGDMARELPPVAPRLRFGSRFP